MWVIFIARQDGDRKRAARMICKCYKKNTGYVVLLLVRNDCCKNFSYLMKEEIYQEPQCFENQ